MERIDHYFEGVAWKYLSAVDAEPDKSNQHELGGLVKAGFKRHLGEPDSDTLKFSAKFIYLAENEDESLIVEGCVSWYDARRKKINRSPELRLYYDANPVTEVITAGMFLTIAKTRKGELFLIFAESDSSAEQQLRWLFDLNGRNDIFASKSLDEAHERASWSALWILELLGIETEHAADEKWLDKIIERFGESFPPTKEFSTFAREAVPDLDSIESMDAVLVTLMDTEERLFRIFEKHIVEKRIAEEVRDIDTFISFSLSVQNRRKSRVGYAFEHHLEYLFKVNKLNYTKGQYTEHRSKPDFLFPGINEYRDPDFPAEKLSLLGVKSTCKDRWRQVLSEAERIPKKHLATLEPGISTYQTEQMRANNLRLVVPSPIQETYSDIQRDWLYSIEDFVNLIREQQICST